MVPALRSRNFSVVCAMTRNGMLHYELHNRAINREKFTDFLNNLQAKLENSNIHRCVMVMDNVPFHRNRDVKSVIEDNGHKLMLLPPYSPFFNPIENIFSMWKSLVKRSKPLNEDELMDAISNGSSLISRDDCEGFVRHMLSNIQKCINGEVSFT